MPRNRVKPCDRRKKLSHQLKVWSDRVNTTFSKYEQSPNRRGLHTLMMEINDHNLVSEEDVDMVIKLSHPDHDPDKGELADWLHVIESRVAPRNP